MALFLLFSYRLVVYDDERRGTLYLLRGFETLKSTRLVFLKVSACCFAVYAY